MNIIAPTHQWRRRDDVETIEQQGAQPVIPPRANRQSQWAFEKHLNKDRNLIERFFNRLKQYQWIAMRYEGLAILLYTLSQRNRWLEVK